MAHIDESPCLWNTGMTVESGFEPRLDSLDESVRSSRPSCQPPTLLTPCVNILIIMSLSLDGIDRLVCGHNNFDEKYNLVDRDDWVGIGERCINTRRYASDTTLLTENKEDLMKLL